MLRIIWYHFVKKKKYTYTFTIQTTGGLVYSHLGSQLERQGYIGRYSNSSNKLYQHYSSPPLCYRGLLKILEILNFTQI